MLSMSGFMLTLLAENWFKGLLFCHWITHRKEVWNTTGSLGFLFWMSVYKCKWGWSVPINIDIYDGVWVSIAMSAR